MILFKFKTVSLFFLNLSITAALAMAFAAGANAAVTINVTEGGGNVIFTTTGSLDLTGAGSPGAIDFDTGFIPGGSNWYEASGSGRTVDTYTLTSFAGPFGTSTSFFHPPNLTFGDNFFIWGQGGTIPEVGVPVGYLSGSPIDSGMVFDTATISGFTMIPGTYVYAIPNDTITLNIGVAAVPEPEIYAMMAAGLGLMGFVGRRRKLQIAAA